ncbi:hypothetical protein Acr_08g0008910 [Actinidia rufa]|uniref:CCHC-type domain-containing protein n=1 Tax=Actinidia rufa TaxID=165716 RepID=A0A7J0F1C8_9ERIC|nr:hypothetical protein Acr_08g0008910 [Actinidia rufa]
MDELRDMMQTLVGAVHAQQQLLQQHFQQSQQPVNQHSECQVCGVRAIKADWRNDYSETAFANLAEYALHLVATNKMRANGLKRDCGTKSKRVVRPMVLPTYAKVLDRAIIVEQDEERKRYQDHKRCHNFQNEGSSRQKQYKMGQSEKSNEGNHKSPVPTCPTCEKNLYGECWWKVTSSRCFNCKEVVHLKRDCPKLRTGVNAVPMIGHGEKNARPGGNENRPGNPGNMSENEQRQGQVFGLMPGDPRNNEDVVAVERNGETKRSINRTTRSTQKNGRIGTRSSNSGTRRPMCNSCGTGDLRRNQA